ncbi:hypothetical protein H5410_060747 [Solanum commersonii]|uniref:Uncharacterized protein n=1 Tax=Solanum commersonii TaxID=4109 RepID=A0A9J5W5X0_SOLCO|nr:hypothetical protein H5410_060747 [Solanum commersonii]
MGVCDKLPKTAEMQRVLFKRENSWDVIGIWDRPNYWDYSASLVEIVDQLGDPLFGRYHRCLALSFSIVMFWIIGWHSTTLRNCSATHCLLLFTADLILSFRAQHTGTKGKDKTFCVHAFPQTPNT